MTADDMVAKRGLSVDLAMMFKSMTMFRMVRRTPHLAESSQLR